MKTFDEIGRELAKPFPPEAIEWRVAEAGETSVGRPWAKVLAYLTNRAIMARLDEVCGCGNWWNHYQPAPDGGVLCGITIRAEVDEAETDVVTKWDGAGNTDIESVKGGLSDSMKRAAVQWGIGRYLYDLDEGWAICSPKKERGDGWRYQKARQGKHASFYWQPPELPQWALPDGHKAKKRRTEPELPEAGEDDNGGGEPVSPQARGASPAASPAPTEPTIDGIPADAFADLDQNGTGIQELTDVCRKWKPTAIEQGWDRALVDFYKKRGEYIKQMELDVFGKDGLR